MNSAAAAPYLDALRRIETPDWLRAERRVALARFLRRGLPTPREEDWRYDSLAHLQRARLHAPSATSAGPAGLEDYPGTLLAFLDDDLIWHDTRLPADVLGTLDAAALRDVARAHLGTLADTGALVQLNAALWRAGACLRVPAGERLRQPVFLRFDAQEHEAMLYPRVLVVMEAGADAVLVEHYLGNTGQPYWRNAVTEIVLGEGARLTHIKLTQESAAATHTGRVAVRQARDSTYRGLGVSLGGLLARHEYAVELAGEGAGARLDGLFVVDGRRQDAHHLRVEHRAPRTVSRQTFRGIADGRGRGVFDGRVVVHAGARHADALQSSRNLLLSPHAEIDAKPQLEIFADEVKCGHGASVGQLDAEQLFYLRSRGIAADAAHAMLLRAFADEALRLLDDAGLRAWLATRLPAMLGEDTP